MGRPGHRLRGKQPCGSRGMPPFPARDLFTTAASPLLVFLFSSGYPNLQGEQSSQADHGGSALGTLALARVVSSKGD